MEISKLPREKIRAVFSDLDDTITENSRVTREAFDALWTLKENNFRVVVVSGRPAGWADCLMRLWPIDAMVFENGAGYLKRDGERIVVVGLANDKNLIEQRAILQERFEALRQEIPELKLATDQPFRLFDYAIDFNEEPPRLPASKVEWILKELAKDSRITAKLSSIHINYWYGKHTKVTAIEHLLANEGKAWGIQSSEIVFCGDSPNDEPMFSFFEHSVGVANVKQFLPKMKTSPRYLTSKESGAGFVELVKHLTRIA